MFDIGWSELLIIAVIAIIVVGPRDLPRMLRTLGQYTRKMRSMAGEFKTQFNEALEEADLGDIKKDVESLRSMDPLKSVKDELSPFKNLGDDIKNTIESPAGVSKEAPQSTSPSQIPTNKPAKPVASKTPRKSSPRATAQTTGSGKSRAKPTKPTTKAPPRATTTKAAASAKPQKSKPAKGEKV